MAGVKEVCIFLTVIALCVQAYVLLGYMSSIKSNYDYYNNTRDVTAIRIMTNNISHVEERHHNSENVQNTSHTSTLLAVKDKVNVDENNRMVPKVSQKGQCHYKVQIYDKKGACVNYSPLSSVVTKSRGGALIPTDIQCDNNCNIEVTLADDKNKFAGMDAVVFHFQKTLIPKPHPPVSMNPNQTWVYFTWESPRSNADEHFAIGAFPAHAIWTYHRGSDIVTPYGYYRPGIPVTNTTKTTEDWVKGKTKLIVWMASNCAYTFWPRTSFVKELNKHIPVDIYGACGPLRCNPRWSKECTVDLLSPYKFYLSLENAECGDYITEKFWDKPLRLGVVPIVYGPNRKVYEDLAPPNSFIYVGDYKNIQELANYLKLLDSNPKLYAKYLEWQYKGSIGIPKPMNGAYEPSLFCKLIPVIEKVKRGELKRTPVKDSEFYKACRKRNTGKKPNGRSLSAYGVGRWDPW